MLPTHPDSSHGPGNQNLPVRKRVNAAARERFVKATFDENFPKIDRMDFKFGEIKTNLEFKFDEIEIFHDFGVVFNYHHVKCCATCTFLYAPYEVLRDLYLCVSSV